MKIIVAALAVISLLFSSPVDAEAASSVKGIVVNGETVRTDVAPVIENGRTLVPLRGVLEALGAQVYWNESSRNAVAFLGDSSVSVTIGDYTAYSNGSPVALDVPAKIINDRTMVPIRFMAESLGYEVSFTEGYVLIYSPENEMYGVEYEDEYEDEFDYEWYYEVTSGFMDMLTGSFAESVKSMVSSVENGYYISESTLSYARGLFQQTEDALKEYEAIDVPSDLYNHHYYMVKAMRGILDSGWIILGCVNKSDYGQVEREMTNALDMLGEVPGYIEKAAANLSWGN